MANNTWQITHGGFTLIELLTSISVLAIISAFSIASFASYNTSQIFQTSVASVDNMLTQARSQAISQVKPTQCNNTVLNGYAVSFISNSEAYNLQVICNATAYTLATSVLPQGVIFKNNTAAQILFTVGSAIVADPGSIYISGNGTTKTITVDSNGTISIQ